jgi:trk system potassium uptake protein
MKKKVLVIGLGDFGKTIAKKLAKNGLSVTAIDRDKKITENASEDLLACITLAQTNAISIEALKELGVGSYNTVVVAIGSHDSRDPFIIVHNLHLLGIKQIITRGHKDDAQALEALGAHRVIVPEIEAALAVAETISKKSDDIVASDNIGKETLITIVIDKESFFLGKNVQEVINSLRDKKINVEIKTIKTIKNDDTINIDPLPDYLLQLNDKIVLMGEREETDKCDSFFAKTQENHEKERAEEEKKKNNQHQ